jgi:hypothetical protein
MSRCGYLILEMSYLRGESLRLRDLEEEMMIYVSCWSCVDGNSYSSSFLPVLVAVLSFRDGSTG